jgi:hypothetical protein
MRRERGGGLEEGFMRMIRKKASDNLILSGPWPTMLYECAVLNWLQERQSSGFE